MTDSSQSGEPVRSRASKQVAEWKASVRGFFEDDWTRLRQLIMQLEEQMWSGATAEGDNRPCPAVDHNDTVPDLSSAARELALTHQRQIPEANVSSDRLLELSRRIEQQLRLSHRRRK